LHTFTDHRCRVAGCAVAQLFEALRYKPEGRGFDFRWCHWIKILYFSVKHGKLIKDNHLLTLLLKIGYMFRHFCHLQNKTK
jgi:hypothetical protein